MKMAQIELQDIVVEFPIYHASARSLKNQLIGRMSLGAPRTPATAFCVKALDGISLVFEHGDRVALLGTNGAGKSTLLRVIAGIYEAMRGRVHSEGRIATLFDVGLGFDPDLTGYENIFLCGVFLGMSRAEIRERRDAIAAFTELGDYLAMPPGTYSSGMKLRLAFAVSTHVDAEILLMDEWIGAGDMAFTKKAECCLAELVGGAAILVLASHSEEIVCRTCNKAVLLRQGMIAHVGEVDEVLHAYKRGEVKRLKFNSRLYSSLDEKLGRMSERLSAVLPLKIFGLDCIENLARCDTLFSSLRKYAAELLVEILVVV
jgi:ABC-2 type transport system ATP-binding protein/lipopolysaccharide transport system ATP-binding protein